MQNKPLYLDIHALQTVPPSCINRDDTGSPKTARYGGVTRARVSSQAWKKAMRDEFQNLLDVDDLGIRTKDAVGLISESILSKEPGIESEKAVSMAAAALGATGIKVTGTATGYLLFIAPRQVHALADLAIKAAKEEAKVSPKEAKGILNPRENPTLNAIDVSLFGRMVADNSALNVDAAAQVAHALGVSASEQEFDYFTAMDDRSPEDTAGAGMIGTVEFLSATLYRYATVDVCHLRQNLGSNEATTRAIRAFVESFVRSMPTGKQNTFANRTLPDAVVIQLRDVQPVSLVGAFEQPVHGSESKSVSLVACERLVERAKSTDAAFGTDPVATYAIASSTQLDRVLSELDTNATSLDKALDSVTADVSAYLENGDLS